MIGLLNKPCISNYGRSNLGQLKCVRLPSIIGAISAIIIEYINSVYTPLRYLESENHIFFTRYFVHEILRLLICNFAGKSALTCNVHYMLYTGYNCMQLQCPDYSF